MFHERGTLVSKTTMKILFVIAFIELLPFFLSTEASNELPRCDPYDPPVRRNINIDSINSRWFFKSLITPKTLPGMQLRTNYNYDIICGGIMVVNGRPDEIDGNACVYETIKLKELPNQRSLTYTSYWKWFGRRIDIRILDTDYKTYAIFWACSQHKKGKCTDFFILIGSKDANGLLQKQLAGLDPILKETVCSSVADLKDWPINPENVCPRRDIFNVEEVSKPKKKA